MVTITLKQVTRAAVLQCNCLVPILAQAFVQQEQESEWEYISKWNIKPTGIYIEAMSGETFSWTLMNETYGRGSYYRPAEGDLEEQVIVWGYDN